MNDDFKSLDKFIETYKSNETNEIIKELERIKMSWTKHKLYIDNEVEWDDLDEAETKFNTLREKDKIYIEDLISKNTNDSSNKEDWEEDWEKECAEECAEEWEEEWEKECAKELKKEVKENTEIDNISINSESDENTIKIIIPKKIVGDLPGVKKGHKHRTSQEIGGTSSVKEEHSKTEICNLYTIIDDIIKTIRDIHQQPEFIGWKQDHFTTYNQKHQTLNSLPKLMKIKLLSYSVSNKTRIETILNYKQQLNYKHYNVTQLMFKSKINFSIDLIEELYTQIVYILHKNLHTYDVDKLIAIFDLLIKNKGSNLLAYISSKTLDSDKYCIKL